MKLNNLEKERGGGERKRERGEKEEEEKRFTRFLIKDFTER